MASELETSSTRLDGRGKRVVVGMSGGVDSSTAAALLQRQGYEVIGVGLRFPLLETCVAQPPPAVMNGLPPSAQAMAPVPQTPRRCCGPAAMEDARAVANQLGIRFAALDYQQLFRREIIEPFFRSYAEGRTPNPCAECNRLIKFGQLLEFAKLMGADFLATGHYARASRDLQSGRRLLLKGADREKDQSYFLYALSQEQLARALFPLGAMTKDETRRLARSFGLPVSEKPGSQDICFLGEGDYRSLLAERHPEALQPGPIVDLRGRVLGTHKGVAGFTVGQRKSLGIAAAAPLYVLALRPAARTVVVGTKEELLQEKFTVLGINWIAADPPPESP